ncbi:MAG: AAA family ATPase [Desulfobulbus sp.]|jgi:exonuclease SbcC
MRIAQIRFKNLNSLVGEWTIDLTDPAFVGDGLFAIVGPTGAGKSTILDAICLALYGRTPRLGKVSKSTNEIMSRQTGECFAEVSFTTRKGSFRCHWSQHRAYRKADGDLQAPKHEIADAETGQIIETRLKDVAEQIEAVTGMDFDRFTRSMLLVQGGFAAFLQAAPDERAPILEQITGTEIYSRISMLVHDRQKVERQLLDGLLAETAGITVLKPEEEDEFNQRLAAALHKKGEVDARVAETTKAMTWLTTIDGLRRDIAALAEEAGRLQSEFDLFKPDRDKLAAAMAAATLDGPHAALEAVRRQQADDRQALAAGEEALPKLATSLQQQVAVLRAAEQQSVQAKESLRAAAPLMQQVRALDQQLAERLRAVVEAEAACKSDAAGIEADNRTREGERARRKAAAKELATVERYLDAHACDAWLVGGLAGVEEQATGLAAVHGEVVRRKEEHSGAVAVHKQTKADLDARHAQCALRRQALEQAGARLRRDREELEQLLEGRLLWEYRAEKDGLLRELALLARIAELEEQRAGLEDGVPCPLCGATTHPFAAGNVPRPDATECRIAALTRLIDRAETLEAALQQGTAAEGAARADLAEAEKQETVAMHEHKAAAKAVAELEAALAKLRADVDGRGQALVEKLRPLGITAISADQVASLLDALRARLAAWQAQVEHKAVMEKTLAGLDSELKQLDAVLATREKALTEKQESLEALRREHVAGSDERRKLYGDKHPDEEEARLNLAITVAEQAEKQAREQHDAQRSHWDGAQARLESLRTGIGRREEELYRMGADFTALLAPAGFQDEAGFVAARLTAAARDKLAAAAATLDERRTELRTRQQDRTARLETEQARALTDQSLAELEPRLRADEEALQALHEEIASIQHRLRENSAAAERLRDRQAAIEAQRTACRRWNTLHELIGSADGKKYRNFAQGLTLEVVISHANNQLRKMTDRYLLIHDQTQPLELSVIDSYQAGEIRSARNLSGGESFLVSLALALGLSQMAGAHVRVDSLFLDEGFGALDDEALDTALDALAGLQRDGKLIGVISHVGALKERIAMQIQVTPQTGGRSRISGPGCHGRV